MVDAGATSGGAADSGPGATIDGGVRLDGGALLDGTVFYVALDDGTLHAYREGTWEQIAMWSGLPVKDGVRERCRPRHGNPLPHARWRRAGPRLTHNIYPGNEQSCAWDCAKDGWLLHSRDGKYVYVGNSGDVIDTVTRKPATYIPTLADARHGFLEMIWSKGAITGTSTHVGMGY